MLIPPTRAGLLLLPLLAGCAADPPAAVASGPAHPRFDSAPMPFVRYGRQETTAGSLEIPLPPKMPLGTGAVPVSSSPVRGSVVTGLKESF